MKNFIATAILAGAIGAAHAGSCGPFTPFNRGVTNADGTELVTMNASCEGEQAVGPWQDTFTFYYPQTIQYYNGTVLQFVGNASMYIEGHHDCVGKGICGVRLVTVDSASVTDSLGNTVQLTKISVGTKTYPVDEWISTQPLEESLQNPAEMVYTLTASGTANVTSPGITDTLHIQATYQVVPPSNPPCYPNCDDRARRQ